jgi:hypothetical protein
VKHVAASGKKRNTYKILVGKLQEKRPSGSLVLDGRVKLKYRKQVIIIYLVNKFPIFM